MTTVASTLYRELHRVGRRIESRTLPHNAARISQQLLLGGSSPRQRVRDAFAAGDSSPSAIDGAFSALRTANYALGWLEPNGQLHDLAAASAPAEDGALLIAELLVAHGAPAPQRELVRAELDRIASTAQELIEERKQEQVERGLGPPTRLHKLSLINRACFEIEGLQVCQEEPIGANASLSAVLSRRKGLPIVLCCIYHAVAARIGVQLAFTPFPRRLLLRLEPEAGHAGHGGAAGSLGDLDDGEEGIAEDDPEVAELMSRLQRGDLETQLAMRGLSTSGRRRRLAERLAFALAEEGMPAAALPSSGARAVAPNELCGLWMAEYGAHGPEVVEVALAAEQRERGSVACAGVLHARKLTGDVHVPAGELSWLATLPRWVGASGGMAHGASVPAAMQVAEAGYRNAQMVDGSLTLADEASLVLSLSPHEADGGGDGARGEEDGARRMTFSRAHPMQEWLVDPSARGALLPPLATTARVGWGPATLRRLGLAAEPTPAAGGEGGGASEEAAERRAALAGSSSPASLWAHMLHDLKTRDEEAGLERARYWEDVGLGLGEASEEVG